MENPLVVGILNIVEDKLREFGIQIPDDARENSSDPLVGYQYAELHDRIYEFLEEVGVFKAPEPIRMKFDTELEMVSLLLASNSLSQEYDMMLQYDKAFADIVDTANESISPQMLDFLRKNASDLETMQTIDEAFHVFTGGGIKDMLNKLANTAIDSLQADLKNVIDASESDFLTSKQRGKLDNQYAAITGVMGELERLIEMPASISELSHSVSQAHKSASLSALIQSASTRAAEAHSTSDVQPKEPEPEL